MHESKCHIDQNLAHVAVSRYLCTDEPFDGFEVDLEVGDKLSS